MMYSSTETEITLNVIDVLLLNDADGVNEVGDVHLLDLSHSSG